MKDQAQVVIIGGGIFGTSIAYHLARAGCTDVVLVEKGELTSGTTFHSVGLVSQFRTSPALMKVMNYTINLYNELAKGEGGDSLGWHTVGSLRLASSKDRLKALQREVSRANAIGLTAGIISPEEVLERCPQLTTDSLYGAVYVPDDGHIDPSGITFEFARLARKMGVEINTNVRVTGIKLSPAREVTEVITDKGNIKTSREVLEESGLPILAKLAERNKLKKKQTDFVAKLLHAAEHPLGPRYDTVKETGRCSASNPNVQQIPRKGGERECFIPRDGYLYVSGQGDNRFVILRVDDPEIRRLAETVPRETLGQ